MTWEGVQRPDPLKKHDIINEHPPTTTTTNSITTSITNTSSALSELNNLGCLKHQLHHIILIKRKIS